MGTFYGKKDVGSFSALDITYSVYGKFESTSVVHTLVCTLIIFQPGVLLLETKNICVFIYMYTFLTNKIVNRVTVGKSDYGLSESLLFCR